MLLGSSPTSLIGNRQVEVMHIMPASNAEHNQQQRPVLCLQSGHMLSSRLVKLIILVSIPVGTKLVTDLEPWSDRNGMLSDTACTSLIRGPHARRRCTLQVLLLMAWVGLQGKGQYREACAGLLGDSM